MQPHVYFSKEHGASKAPCGMQKPQTVWSAQPTTELCSHHRAIASRQPCGMQEPTALTLLCCPDLPSCAERSTYSKVFANIDERPIQFRKDGLPISARRVASKPLMTQKLPSLAELTVSKRLCAKYNHTTSVCIGVPGRRDPRHFNSVYSLVHTAPHRYMACHMRSIRQPATAQQWPDLCGLA
jgi:hypothetical protein